MSDTDFIPDPGRGESTSTTLFRVLSESQFFLLDAFSVAGGDAFVSRGVAAGLSGTPRSSSGGGAG